MDALISIGSGIFALLLGFKIYNPFTGKNTPDKEEAFYRRYGKMLKVCGFVVISIGILRFFFEK